MGVCPHVQLMCKWDADDQEELIDADTICADQLFLVNRRLFFRLYQCQPVVLPV